MGCMCEFGCSTLLVIGRFDCHDRPAPSTDSRQPTGRAHAWGPALPAPVHAWTWSTYIHIPSVTHMHHQPFFSTCGVLVTSRTSGVSVSSPTDEACHPDSCPSSDSLYCVCMCASMGRDEVGGRLVVSDRLPPDAIVMCRTDLVVEGHPDIVLEAGAEVDHHLGLQRRHPKLGAAPHLCVGIVGQS